MGRPKKTGTAAPAQPETTNAAPKKRGRPPKADKAAKQVKAPTPPKEGKAAKVPKESKAPQPKPEDWVIEALQSLQTGDNPYVGLRKIQKYIHTFIEEATPRSIPRLTQKAVASLFLNKVVKQKKESIAFHPKAGDVATTKAPARVAVCEPPPKKVKGAIDRPQETGALVKITRSGRISLERF
jgi:hypothetical protein